MNRRVQSHRIRCFDERYACRKAFLVHPRHGWGRFLPWTTVNLVLLSFFYRLWDSKTVIVVFYDGQQTLPALANWCELCLLQANPGPVGSRILRWSSGISRASMIRTRSKAVQLCPCVSFCRSCRQTPCRVLHDT